MAYPQKSEHEKRTAFGLSLPTELVERIDAFEPRRGRRSQFISDTLEIGLERRFGPHWREMADQLRTKQVDERSDKNEPEAA